MSSEAPVMTFAPEILQADRLRNFRIIPRLETYPALVSLAQTVAGKLGLLTLFGLILYLADERSWLMVLCLALPTFLPQKRHQAVTFATLTYTTAMIWMQMGHPFGEMLMVATALAFGAFLIWLTSYWPYLKAGLRPLAVLFGGFSSLILICAWLPEQNSLSAPLWKFAVVLGSYVWFIGYVLLDREARPVQKFGLEIGSLQPFWGST